MLNRTINLLYFRNIQQTKRLWFSSIIPENKIIIPVNKKRNEKIYNKSDNELRAIKLDELNQKQYFLKDDPDVFGSLTTPVKELLNETPQDEGDFKEEELLSSPVSKSQKLSTKQYADIIKTYIKKRQIKEAIDVLEVRMIKEDRVKPENYIYNLILGACGRVGYTKKAFKLFNDMKKRGLKPTNGTYTALFNACSNSPWLEDGLSRATKLRELIQEKGIILNDTNYNAMIKAFGRCGDLSTAFSLVDEMIENKIIVKNETINFLLQSCISDTEAGFRHALLVWRKFHNKNIKPDIFSFNLMLRCIRDCNLGDTETMSNLLQSPEFKLLENKSQLKLENTNKTEQNELDLISIPNLMAPVPYLGNIIKLNDITKPEDRLLLVGGCSGFLKNMEYFEVKPDIKTFSQLLDSIPGTISAENALLSAMKKEGVKYDVDFLNMLVKKRSMRFDYENSRAVVETLFKLPKLRPNLMTYGVLALSCKRKEQANELIKEMKEGGYRLNIVILGAMLKQACIKMNFVYVIELMEIVVREQIEPNKVFIQHLEDLYKRAKRESNEYTPGNFFTKGFKIFRIRYKTWLTQIKMDTSDEQHPWDQFRNASSENAKYYKDKEEHFKPRISSRFRVKTGTLHK